MDKDPRVMAHSEGTHKEKTMKNHNLNMETKNKILSERAVPRGYRKIDQI
jgi:hypothetical protein